MMVVMVSQSGMLRNGAIGNRFIDRSMGRTVRSGTGKARGKERPDHSRGCEF